MTKLIMAAAIAALVAGIGGAKAQTYPSRPITMIAPFPANLRRLSLLNERMQCTVHNIR